MSIDQSRELTGSDPQDRQEAPDDGARGCTVQPLYGEIEERLRYERNRGNANRGGEDDGAEKGRKRSPVGDAAAEPVAERERRQHDPDQVGPDDGGRAEVRREQTGGADLGRQRAGTGEEDENAQPAEGGASSRATDRHGFP